MKRKMKMRSCQRLPNLNMRKKMEMGRTFRMEKKRMETGQDLQRMKKMRMKRMRRKRKRGQKLRRSKLF